MKETTMEEMVKPPFPDKMTFKEILTNLFNLDFMTPDEQQTIFDAGEMYANGCLKIARENKITAEQNNYIS